MQAEATMGCNDSEILQMVERPQKSVAGLLRRAAQRLGDLLPDYSPQVK